MKTCTTHHFACDCREAKFREMEQERNRLLNALQAIKEKDGPGLDGSPGGPCYDIAKAVLK